MKKTNLFLFSLIALTAFIQLPAHAEGNDDSGKATCEQWVNEYSDVHCTYVSGLPHDYQGRYIKHYNPTEKVSYTRCVSADMVESDIYQNEAEWYLGTHNVQYSICTDANAEHCEPLATDTFTIAKDGENYVGQPTTYGIDVSAVKDKYPACSGFEPNLKHTIKLPIKAKR
jgi:hypothetical protein